ncbi:Helix-turn-helix domain-containing protein [Evansella caseinilytica]|uniref:Helix-turn-helix domain-containing protein n=1 Tax=Evansella caseinilytica TaxID=1503961 RepID=A0A1H3QC15_9BACI|nr:helix-turn-helix domain-containing protein [Evansella caseinilytica]SDZ10897.1 Helix-turn-helix domain-containing protein [Evansella caseinilytica]
MTQSKGDVLLHPVRMKIIQALAGRSMTVQQLLDNIKEVPQATMYRQLNILKKHGIVIVEGEQPIRGAVEKTYTLDTRKSFITPDEAKHISKEEFIRYFIMYYANLVRMTEEYFEGEVDFDTDGYGFHQLELQLNREEWTNFRQDYQQLLKKYHFDPRPDRRKRTMAAAFIPEKSSDGGWSGNGK